MKKALLVIGESGSRRKEPADPIPAIERYTGLSINIIKNAQKKGFGKNMDTFIVTKEKGLIPIEEPISYYPAINFPMTYTPPKISDEDLKRLKEKVRKQLEMISWDDYSQVFVNLGRNYSFIVEEISMLKISNVTAAKGSMGEKARQMRQWIESLS